MKRKDDMDALNRARREDGAVMIAVLWICALVMWLALQVGYEVRLHGEERVHELRRSQALHIAIGGCYEALARMGTTGPTIKGLDDAADRLNWKPNRRPHIVDYENGQAMVVVESENNKVNVNRAGREQ
ncbi:MAG: hypothetical protein ACLGPL_11320, partial [Acidobacteriota bacterium]